MRTILKHWSIYVLFLGILSSCATQQTKLLCHSWTQESMIGDGEKINFKCIEIFKANGVHIRKSLYPNDSTMERNKTTWTWGKKDRELIVNGEPFHIERLDRKHLWYSFTDVGDCDSNSTSELRTIHGICYEIDTVFVKLVRK